MTGLRPIEVGDELRVRLRGACNGPVRATDVTDQYFRLATMRGHMEAGEIESRAHDDEDGELGIAPSCSSTCGGGRGRPSEAGRSP